MRFDVSIPIAGSVVFYGIEAESPEAAIEAAFECSVRFNVAKDEAGAEFDEVDVELGDELAMLRRITSGNVSHAPVNDAEAIESAA